MLLDLSSSVLRPWRFHVRPSGVAYDSHAAPCAAASARIAVPQQLSQVPHPRASVVRDGGHTLLLEKVAQLFDMLHRCRIDNSSALELPDQAQQLPLLVDCDWSIAGSWWHNDFPTPAGMIASVCRPASTASMTACCPGRRPVRPNTRFRTVVTRRRAIGGLMVKETPSRPRSSRRQ
jgi:hypothetical protein